MQLVDTHCHIHEPNYSLALGDVLVRARQAEVDRMICVGTNQQSSKEAILFAKKHEGVFAAMGVHPHDTQDGWDEIATLAAGILDRSLIAPASKQTSSRHAASASTSLSAAELAGAQTSSPIQEAKAEASGRAGDVSSVGTMKTSTELRQTLVAIGEIGLDYFYAHSPRDVQILALEAQIAIALHYNLPIIFHVREAFDDFWPIFDNFHGIRGELHSFTDTVKNLEEGLKRGLFIGINGISTFTKDQQQKKMFAAVPLEKMLLETDAPFLTPTPLRGKINEPAFVRNVAEFQAGERGLSLMEIALVTTANARALFALS